MDELRKKIEETRQKIYDLVNEKGLDSPEVLEMSQILDQMLNENVNILRRMTDKVPPRHIRIAPNGIGYSVALQNKEQQILIGFCETFEAAATLARNSAIAKRGKLKIYYLEQQVTD